MSDTTSTTGRGRPRLATALAAVLVATVLAPLAAAPARAASVDTTSNQIGRLTSVGNGQMRRFFEYDALGRPMRAEHALDGTPHVLATTYGYPQNPDTTAGPGTVPRTMTLPDGERVVYGYDASGAQRTIASTRPGGVTADAIVTDMRRNARGQTVAVTYGNGVVTTHAYRDATDLRLERIQTTAPGLGIVQDYVYGFDPNGNVTSLADGVVPSFSATYGYDTLDQLASMTSNGSTSSYQYDSTGNLTVKEGAVQGYGGVGRGSHALATAGGVTFAYDFNGNVASSTAGLVLEWNAENMATRATVGGVERNRKSFLGEELWKKVEGSVTTLYLPGVLIENGQHRKFFGMLAERSPDGSLKFYHGDHLGSSTVVTDSSRTVVNRIAYMPFGEDRGPRGGSFVPRYQFNFKEKDATGFYDYGARLYNPATGRWLSPDDETTDGLNRYAYVRNNPLYYRDPTGHAGDGGFLEGLWEGTKNAVMGAVDAVRDPVGAAVGTYHAVVDAAKFWTEAAQKPGEAWGAIKRDIVHNPKNLGNLTAQVGIGVLTRKVGVRTVSHVRHTRSLSRARAARDRVATELGPKKPPERPATVTAGYNTKTGKVATGCSGGGCAEGKVVEALGGDKSQVRFTEAVRPRPGGPPFTQVPVCEICESLYGRKPFPSGTLFKTDGN